MRRIATLVAAMAVAFAIFYASDGYRLEESSLVVGAAIAVTAVGLPPREAARMGAITGLVGIVVLYLGSDLLVSALDATGTRPYYADDGSTTAGGVLLLLFLILGGLAAAAGAGCWGTLCGRLDSPPAPVSGG